MGDGGGGLRVEDFGGECDFGESGGVKKTVFGTDVVVVSVSKGGCQCLQSIGFRA